ncbi:MAG: hypothetical protein QM687_11055 [Ferruginibacter sp.]
MKRLLSIVFFSIIFSAGNAFAQRINLLSIGDNTVIIDSVYMQDSVAGGRLISTVSFSINLNESEPLSAVLNVLQASLLKNAPVDMMIVSGNAISSFKKIYTAATTLEFSFPRLDGSARSVARVAVKIRSASARSEENGGPASFKGGSSRAVLSSNYSVSLNGLPANRVAGINFAQLRGTHWVQVDISAADIEQWNNWLSSGGKRMDGSVFLLAPDMRTRVKEIKLLGAEIVSLSRSAVNNDERVQRFTVLLKVNNILLESLK